MFQYHSKITANVPNAEFVATISADQTNIIKNLYHQGTLQTCPYLPFDED